MQSATENTQGHIKHYSILRQINKESNQRISYQIRGVSGGGRCGDNVNSKEIESRDFGSKKERIDLYQPSFILENIL